MHLAALVSPPAPLCYFFPIQYVDAIRFGDLTSFLRIEAACKAWWTPTMDRGAGALLHFAVEHGRLQLVKFLLEERGVPVNQRCIRTGWTPLHRCAHVAHYRHAPFLEIFEHLLRAGADASFKTYAIGGTPAASILDLVVKKARIINH